MADTSTVNGDTTPTETLICPSCERPTDREHMTIVGVCGYCRKSFHAANRSWVEGKQSKPTEEHNLNEHRVRQECHADNEAGDASLHPCEITEFDYASLDVPTGGFDPDVIAKAADALERLFAFAFDGCSAAVGVRRLSAAMFALRPDLVKERTLEELGKSLGVGKASASRWSLRFADSFGLQLRSRSRKAARQHMAEAMRASHKRRGHKLRGGLDGAA